MTVNQLQTANIYTDFNGLAELRRDARRESPAALQEVAEQFEAMFLQMMLKSMRDAKLADGILDTQTTDTYMGMFDQQLALNLAQGAPLGIAEMITQQLAPRESVATNIDSTSAMHKSEINKNQNDVITVEPKQDSVTSSKENDNVIFNTPQDFVDNLLPYAKQAAKKLNVSPAVLLAQAALETGWGKKIIKDTDGNSSFNLFGIKAQTNWLGEKVSVATVEFIDGMVEKIPAAFRAYDSFQQSFDDYVDFLLNNPRYQEVIQSEDPEQYIQALQDSGYATDPKYAEKIQSIYNRDVMKDAQA